MDRLLQSRIAEDLESSEVAALCFLCADVVPKKSLQGIKDAKELFVKLEDRGLLENGLFLFQLLNTLHRADLCGLIEPDRCQTEETDAIPTLSPYRVMLYNIYEDLTEENFGKMKFLLSPKLHQRNLEASDTALDLFVEMEKTGLLSKNDVDELLGTLLEIDRPLALTVQRHKELVNRQTTIPPHISIDNLRVNSSTRTQAIQSISEPQPSYERERIRSDAETGKESPSHPDETQYYALNHNPHGLCVVINNEDFLGSELTKRNGTQEDAKTLKSVFSRLGFRVVVHHNLTAADIRLKLKELGKTNFYDHDALVVCVLSHGEKGCVYGTDVLQVSIKELTEPFTSKRATTLAGKPKLFFIQACQGSAYQGGALPCPPSPQEEMVRESCLEEDAGPVHGEKVAWGADFLLGMATVPECKSFRNTSKGSIYIQELCRQLIKSAESSEKEDIHTVLTNVNRNVSKGEYLNHKQMPEPKYTLTKKLVLRFA